MSLRQRSQRPSEASNESSYNASGSRQSPLPPPASSSGGWLTPQASLARRRATSAALPVAPASAGAHGGSGYYNPAVYPGTPATPAAPRSTGYHDFPRVRQQPTQAAYPPNPNTGDYFRSESMPTLGKSNSSGYTNSIGSSVSSSATNPYQKSKSSLGKPTCTRVFLGLLAITSFVLTCTTIHFRGIMKQREADLNNEKRILERRGRGEDAERTARERHRPHHTPSKGQHDAYEKEQLERDIRQLQSDVKAHKAKHTDILTQQQAQTKRLEGMVTKRQDLAKTIDHTKNVLEDEVAEASKYEAMVDGLDAMEEYMTKREGALWGRIDLLETRIGRDSWREAAEWFGPGPHRVEMDIEYPRVPSQTNPDASTWPRTRSTIVLEMAPLDVMPHTVNLFLQQVHHRLWNSCAVVSNANHIFQMGPSYQTEDALVGSASVDGSVTKTHYEHFRAKGLDKVTYQEYNAQYPHEQWTVGLAGRPGGPNFYINKRNNTQIHGPGGQLNKHDLHNEADPCFAKVVQGIETLTEIGEVPTDPENNYAFKYPVVIIETRVLAPKENPAEGWQAVPPGEKFDHGQILPFPDAPHAS